MANIITAQVQILECEEDLVQAPHDIEIAGRTCYKSNELMTRNTAEDFCRMLIKRGHESVLEHAKCTVQFICDRGVTHELVRHRLSSFSQESTRYCNYSKDKFCNQVTFIDITNGLRIENKLSEDEISEVYRVWVDSIEYAENKYFELLRNGATPQFARSVLPNSTASTIVVTANIRQWRTILKQRTAKAAHPQMREIMIPLYNKFVEIMPCLFDDIEVES